MYEDWQIDECFQVESSGAFLDRLSGDEQDFLYNGSGLKACPNCGEFVSKLYNGVCNLCNTSEFHREKRGECSGDNLNRDIDFFREFNNR